MRTTAVSAVAVRCSMQKSRGIQYRALQHDKVAVMASAHFLYTTPKKEKKKKGINVHVLISFLFMLALVTLREGISI